MVVVEHTWKHQDGRLAGAESQPGGAPPAEGGAGEGAGGRLTRRSSAARSASLPLCLEEKASQRLGAGGSLLRSSHRSGSADPPLDQRPELSRGGIGR